jgi:hypothetical protein
MADYKERFGLDFLLTKKQATSQRTAPEPLPPGLEDALLAYGGRVVNALKSAAGQKRTLFELLDDTGTRIDTLLPVMNHLVSKGYIARTAEDPKGNDTFQLTDAGQKVPA